MNEIMININNDRQKITDLFVKKLQKDKEKKSYNFF